MEQKKRGNVRASANRPCHRYAGLLECGDCGSTFTSVKRTWNGVERIEYVCNGYHRYGKENCPPHRIRETELDEIIYGEISNVKEQAAQLYENIDGEVRKWLKKKSTVTGKIRQLNAELEQKKSDQKEILLERIRELGLNEEDYDFYLDLRKYGSNRHAGFGMGFERLVMYLTGIGNIRDAIPFPRTVNNCEL